MRPKLICLPFAGGAASYYRSWVKELEPTIEVQAIQLPGRENKFSELLVTDLATLVRYIRNEIRLHAGQPLSIFGHSMGSLLAYALAAHLQDEEPASRLQHLFVSGRNPPFLPLNKTPLHDAEDGVLIQEIIELGGTSAAVFDNPELLRVVLPIMRADFTINEKFVPLQRRQFQCGLTVFTGETDKHVEAESLQLWQEITPQPMNFMPLPGGHFFLNEQRPVILNHIRRTLTGPKEA